MYFVSVDFEQTSTRVTCYVTRGFAQILLTRLARRPYSRQNLQMVDYQRAVTQ